MEAIEKLKNFISSVQSVPILEWPYFISQLKIVSLKKGDFLFKENEKSYVVGFVAKGLIHTFYITSEGKQKTKNFAWEGRLISPWVSILEDTAPTFSAQALESTIIVTIDARTLKKLEKKNYCWESLSRKCTEKILKERERREYEFLALSFKERLQAFNHFYEDIIGRIPEYLIASYLGLTPEGLSRIKNS